LILPTPNAADFTYAERRAIEEDHFPNAPRLGPLRSALAKLDPAAAAPAQGGKRLRR
jgi:hypothetical protein